MGYRDSNYDVPDPGTGNGRETPMVLTCTGCAWRVSDISPIKAVHAAQEHARTTQHEISYRGVVQAWSKQPARGTRGEAA